MTLNSVVGVIATVCLFVPILIILMFRLAWYKSFPALLAYYLILFSYNLLSITTVKPTDNFMYYFGVVCNLLDAPLMLTFITYFSPTALVRKRIKLVVPAFLLFELVIIALYGFNVRAATIVLGPGLGLVLVFSILFFVHQAKITVIHQKAIGKAFMVAGLLFAYGGYSFIYVVYYILKTKYRDDTYLVYFLVCIFSSLLVSAGVFFERKRVKQLAEVQTTRKELKLIYGRSEKSDPPISKRQFY